MARSGKYAEYRRVIRELRNELHEKSRCVETLSALLGLQERRLAHGMNFLLELDGGGFWQRLRYLVRGKVGKHTSVFNCECQVAETGCGPAGAILMQSSREAGDTMPGLGHDPFSADRKQSCPAPAGHVHVFAPAREVMRSRERAQVKAEG